MVKNKHCPLIDVTCAIIVRDGKVLVAKRSHEMDQAGLWEFPGGKVDKNESPENCLFREIREELKLNIQITYSLSPIVHHYPDISIRLIPFITSIVEGHPLALEHEKVQWFLPADLKKLAWSPADIPVLNEYLSMHS